MKKRRKNRMQKGFTMVELMAMLIIIGLLATLVATKVASKIDEARVTTTKANLKTLHMAEVPQDAWHNDFYYELYPESGKPFVIISWGADGEEGGEGHDTDLYSTDAK
jgi:general secretion pathway protein G